MKLNIDHIMKRLIHYAALLQFACCVAGRTLNSDIIQCIQKYGNNTVQLIDPSSSNYTDARIGTNFRYDDFYPSAIINVTKWTDMQVGVRCGKEHRVEIIPMNGGHSMEGASCTNGIQLHLDYYSNIISYQLSPDSSYVKVESGMRLARLYGLVWQLNLNHTDTTDSGVYVFSGGTCPDVGVTGHVLCGGYGYLSRLIGMTSDQITEFEVINPDGELIVVNNSSSSYQELFWAMRGSCVSSYGIVVSMTFKLTYLPYANMTTLRLIVPPTNTNTSTIDIVPAAVDFVYWWQEWASVNVSTRFTSTIMFEPYYNFTFMGLYLGSRDEAIAATNASLYEALQSFYTPEQLLEAYKEVSYFDAIVWFTGDKSLQTLDDFLGVISLPPLGERSTSRRKVKSAMIMESITKDGIEELMSMRHNKTVNQIEWKAHAGVHRIGNCSADDTESGAIGVANDRCMNRLYTDNQSPLLRGELFEMHYGNSSGSGNDTTDQILVNGMNSLADYLSKYFTHNRNASYVGYIDNDLKEPGVSYFGHKNTQKLTELLIKTDPEGILTSNMSRYLFPKSVPLEEVHGQG